MKLRLVSGTFVWAIMAASQMLCSHLFAQGYRITPIQGLSSFPYTMGRDINESGQVAGRAYSSGGASDATKNQAFLYSAGTTKDLGTLSGYQRSLAEGINDSGVIAATAVNTLFDTRAFVREVSGNKIDIGAMLGSTESGATSIAPNGYVTGYYLDRNVNYAKAFLYKDRSVSAVRLPSGYLQANGHGVNSSGHVVGNAFNGLPEPTGLTFSLNFFGRPFVATPGSTIALGTLGGENGGATAINEFGEVAGAAQVATGKYHAFYYHLSHMRDIGVPQGFVESYAYDINDNADIVGTALSSSGRYHAFIYKDAIMTDLNGLVPLSDGTTAGFVELNGASGITRSGLITGHGLWTNGPGGGSYTRAFVLTPDDSAIVAQPVISPEGGTFPGAVQVTLACSTSGATIRYTTDGIDPSESSPAYVSPLTISKSVTLKARGFKTGTVASSVAAATFTINPVANTVATPVISPNGGAFIGSVAVSINCPTAGATIRYTIDGSQPGPASSVYTGAFTLTASANVRAAAFLTGWNDSATALAGFQVSPSAATVSTPVISPNGGEFRRRVKVTLTCATAGAEIRYTTNGSEPTATSGKYGRPFVLKKSATVKAKAFKSGSTSSATASAAFVKGR